VTSSFSRSYIQFSRWRTRGSLEVHDTAISTFDSSHCQYEAY